jgi:hypothetical protein
VQVNLSIRLKKAVVQSSTDQTNSIRVTISDTAGPKVASMSVSAFPQPDADGTVTVQIAVPGVDADNPWTGVVEALDADLRGLGAAISFDQSIVTASENQQWLPDAVVSATLS